MGVIRRSRPPATISVQRTLFNGTRVVPSNFLGISTWYVPFSASFTSAMLDPSLYSINRYSSWKGHINWKITWPGVNTAEDVYDWSVMDSWVNYHHERGTELLAQVAGHCPAWATARPAEIASVYNTTTLQWDSGAPTEPGNMLHFKKWLEAVGQRYDGKIKYWLMPNEPTFAVGSEFTGTAEKYAEMCRIASQVLKNINPTNKICGPEPSAISSPRRATPLFAALNASAAGYDAGFGTGAGTTGKDWIDVISVHPYSGGYARPSDPYGNFDNYPALFSELSAAGLSGKEVWASEIMIQPPDNNNDQNEFTFLNRDAVIAAINGVTRYIWFGYGGGSRPWGQINERGTQAKIAWAQLREVLYGGGAITKVELMSDNDLRVTKQDGRVYII